MAKRIGKYKVDQKESTLSIADGGTVTGNLSVTGDVTLSGLGTIKGSSNVLYTTASFVSGSAGGNAETLKIVCLG